MIKVIHETSISVFYCDFGYYANLTSQQLMPLDYEFTLLPFQAIKAKLVGKYSTSSFFLLFHRNLVSAKVVVAEYNPGILGPRSTNPGIGKNC